jgi:type II secretory pathway component PulL
MERRVRNMKKIGFIDLLRVRPGKPTGQVYVFRDDRGNYELDTSFEYSGDSAPVLQSRIGDIREYVLSIPLEVLNFRVLKLPFSDKGKIMKVIPFELEGLMMGGADSIVFDSRVLRESGNTFDVLVAYVEKGVMGDILTMLAAQGIDPHIVTSLELRAMKAQGADDMALRLMSPEKIHDEERIQAARDELAEYTINLRTGPFAYTKDLDKVGKTLRTTAILFMLLALLIHAHLAFRIVTERREASSLKRELRNTYRGLFPEDTRITDELYQMKSRMKEMKEKEDAMIGVSPLPFLFDVSKNTASGLSFSELSLERGITTMKGEATSVDDIEKMKTRLSGILGDVSVSDIKPSVGGKTLFTMVSKGRRQ